jgi:hypothetical protein
MSTSAASRDVRAHECPDILLRVASTRADRAGAFRLAYQSYLRAELCGPCDLGLRITPHQLLMSTDIIVAELRGEIISTLSLVRDGELGLPMESIYAEEVRTRREAGLRLAEVSCLADRRQSSARYFGLFCDLARLMIQMADREGVDQLLIAVHPRHARMYCRAMAFSRIGENRDYPSVNGNPAVPLCLDLEFVKKHRPAIWQRFAGDPLPLDAIERQPIGAADRDFFDRLLRRGAVHEVESAPGLAAVASEPRAALLIA